MASIKASRTGPLCHQRGVITNEMSVGGEITSADESPPIVEIVPPLSSTTTA